MVRAATMTMVFSSFAVFPLFGCVQGYLIVPDQTPKDQWPEAEGRILQHVRQVTNQDLGLRKAGEAYFSPDMKRIIFQAYPGEEDEYQMFTMELTADGLPRQDTLRQISPGGGPCSCGYFHPDGERLLFGSAHLNPNIENPNFYQREGGSYNWEMPGGMDLFEADLDGSNLHRLTTEIGYDAECAYSPSGASIVFTSDRDGDPDIYIMRSDGAEVRQLTNSPGYDGGPFFSPEGQRIIFRADRHQNDLLQLFVINTDGSGERQLTQHGPVVRWAPYWHPNGRSVVYTTSTHGHRNYEVYLLNIDTGKSQRVTHSPRFDGLPVISPDGRLMMWTSERGKTGTSQIFIAEFTLPEGL